MRISASKQLLAEKEPAASMRASPCFSAATRSCPPVERFAVMKCLFLRHDAHRAVMARMPRLCMVEHSDPHVEIVTWYEGFVISAVGFHVANQFERPMPVAPF